MRILDQPLPGTRHDCCVICGLFDQTGVWVDFELDIEYEGWIGICEACGKEIAAMLGCPPSEAVAQLSAENQRLRDRLGSLEATTAKVKELL